MIFGGIMRCLARWINVLKQTLVGNYLLAKFRNRNRVLELEHKNSRLESKLTEQDTTSKNEIRILKEEHAKAITEIVNRLTEYENRERILAEYTFNKLTQTMLHRCGKQPSDTSW